MTTFATADLCNIMLRDSAHIQEFEAEWRNRKGRRAGVPEFEPLYVMADAEAAINLFVPCGYGERLHICDGVEIPVYKMSAYLLGYGKLLRFWSYRR